MISGDIDDQVATFAITDAQRYVLVVTLSAKNNAKLLDPLKSYSKRIINWNKYQSKVPIERQNQYLDYLIDSCFLGSRHSFYSVI